ncbi:MAG TPA: 3-methyl-2-oxobutanoate dehydrogenase subunit VorB [Firmicutes bacterium]|nr:3-methyl-2-oxobutanoate dehydrogenase subunit VorB [Bacillota bacterium]
MGEKVLMKGNEAIAEAAIRAGCRYFFGYPITPQNEIPEYMARRLPQVGGVFLQAESEVAAINMVYGAAAAGGRVMTSSSGPGISLKQEGLSYMAGAELPCVVVNMVRAGPGLGGIQAAQSDYFQATKGGGHGDYRLVVYGPASIQEAVDLMAHAFDVADRYRTPVMLLGDGMLGQMMEPVEFPDYQVNIPVKDWITNGASGRPARVISSIFLKPEELDAHCWAMKRKYEEIAENETRVECLGLDDADFCLVAYGTTARICRSVMEKARESGLRVGLIRPISLWPFPTNTIREVASGNVKAFLTVEMSTGQMIEDVMLAVNGKKPVHFYGKTGGMVPAPRDILAKLRVVADDPEKGRMN